MCKVIPKIVFLAMLGFPRLNSHGSSTVNIAQRYWCGKLGSSLVELREGRTFKGWGVLRSSKELMGLRV